MMRTTMTLGLLLMAATSTAAPVQVPAPPRPERGRPAPQLDVRPQRPRIVCGMTIFSPPPNAREIDPGIRKPPPRSAQDRPVKPTIRAIHPRTCSLDEPKAGIREPKADSSPLEQQ